MRLSISILLSCIILSSSIKVSFFYNWRAIDMDSFTEQLCQNNTLPELQCYGKCYLEKIMVAEGRAESSISSSLLDLQQMVYLPIDITKPILEKIIPFSQRSSFIYLAHPIFDVAYSIFHPPRQL